MNASDQDKKPPIQVNIDPDKLESKYSDAIFINHNPFGFTFDFAQSIPQMKMIKVGSRISLSPQHAKVLLGALQNQIVQYEKKFGEIMINQAMQEAADKKPIGFEVE